MVSSGAWRFDTGGPGSYLSFCTGNILNSDFDFVSGQWFEFCVVSLGPKTSSVNYVFLLRGSQESMGE